jgi:dephospho-CoA kinase
VKTLGLTGSIATGKSTVLKAFAALGIPALSADEVVHELYRGGEAVVRIEALFPGTATPDGSVDRAELARRLVAAPRRLGELEAAVHPLVRERIAAFRAAAQEAGADLAVVDVPLLFESGYDYGFDAVAVTAVGEEEQRRRALARPGMTVEKLETILARQMPQAEKLGRADYVIDTSGSLAATDAQVAAIAAAIGGQKEP